MYIRFPLLASLSLAAGLVLAGCGQMTPDNGEASKTCANLEATAQKYMQGLPNEPVRCEPQKEAPWKPGELSDGSTAG